MNSAKITLQDYVKINLFLNDKNEVYKYNFFANDCKADFSNLYNLENTEIQKNIDFWAQIFHLEKTWHNEIEGYALISMQEMTTEGWVTLSNLIENVEHTEQSFYQIIQYFISEDITIDEVRELPFKKCVENINYFFLNYRKHIISSQMFSKHNLN